MRRFFVVLAFVLATLTAIVPARSATAAPARVTQATYDRIVYLVNQHRVSYGLVPVNVHSVLTPCAQQYSEVLASQGRISHTGPDGSSPGDRLTRCGYRWRVYGENPAAGFVDPDRLVQAWMDSPSHRRIILHAKVRDIGIGYAYRANDPSRYHDYWTLEVGVSR